MTASSDRLGDGLEPLSTRHWVGIGLAVVTAAVHLVLGLGFLPHWMGGAFLVATAGFGLGVVLVVLDYRRRLVYLLGIPFTGAQVVLWYVLNRPAGVGDLSGLEAVDKIAQALLLVALVVLYRRE
ncbi:hypothetical protein GS429_16955 [Natronorubrum sp. JWXQ-INN-674]|uniref:Uncharacterized protein n=1 Tax=Natronorubrum halalkaliphilum TaxID=2691917 RepID=A0A6B0VRL2_9EURY|nr:hypothetical protein [Natronorubrum halalkaliphilum]MXV63717.1 hypothetical protein [Natronorubrum halalkaliphilum]